MKLRLAPLFILWMFPISLNSLAQAEAVTVVASSVVAKQRTTTPASQPQPTVDSHTSCRGDSEAFDNFGSFSIHCNTTSVPSSSSGGGFLEGFNNHAFYTYYTVVQSDHNAYLLSCTREFRWDHCPILMPGQHYGLSANGNRVLLQAADAAKPFKMELVQAAAVRGAANGASTSRDSGPQSKPVATETLPAAHVGVSDSPVSALTFDGNQLLERCNSSLKVADDRSSADKDDLFNAAYCVGYLHAISDNTAVEVELFKGQGNGQVVSNLFCLPKGPTYEQLVRVVVKWMNDNPAKLHESAWWVVDSALRDAFPCR